MAKTVYLDTGPLVAFFNKRDQFHTWVLGEMAQLDAVFVTCEAVLTEVLFLTKNSPLVLNALSGMMNDGLLSLEPVLSESPGKVFELLVKYHDSGASLADICLVYLFNKRAERIFTTDSDFLNYRDSNGKPLELISPYAN